MSTEKEIKTFRDSVVEPPDFDAFWRAVQEELNGIPLDPELTPLPLRSTPRARVYEVHYTSLGGLRIAGWFCVPTRGSGPFSTFIHFPGYMAEPALQRHWAEEGIACLTVAVRGKLRSNREFNPGYPGLFTWGLESPQTYAYRGLISDTMRGVDFLLSRPEVDASRIFAYGTSQGGGLTLTTAALRQEIKGGVAGFPFLCAYDDAMRLTRSYPYNELTCYWRANPDRREQMLITLSYFDAVNFAKRIDRPMAVGIGMEDEVCPPQTCYAAYRQLRGEKTLWMLPDTGHGASAEFSRREADWLRGKAHL